MERVESSKSLDFDRSSLLQLLAASWAPWTHHESHGIKAARHIPTASSPTLVETCGVSAFDTTSSNQPHKPREPAGYSDMIIYSIMFINVHGQPSMRDEQRISHWIVQQGAGRGKIGRRFFGKSAVTHWLVQVSNIAQQMDQLKKSLTNWSCNINHQLKWCFFHGKCEAWKHIKNLLLVSSTCIPLQAVVYVRRLPHWVKCYERAP